MPATLFFGLVPFFERAFDDATGAPGSATLALVSASSVVWLVLLVMGSRFCALRAHDDSSLHRLQNASQY
jgi:hypothetical protein